MSPEKITSLAQDSISSGSDSSTGPPLPALDYSLELLRQLRDVVISARDNSKLFAHKAILAKDPFFAALFTTTTTTKVSSNSRQSPVLAEYHLDEHPDVLRRRIERAYNGGELRQQEQEEIVVLRAKKKSNHVNGGNRHYQVGK